VEEFNRWSLLVTRELVTVSEVYVCVIWYQLPWAVLDIGVLNEFLLLLHWCNMLATEV